MAKATIKLITKPTGEKSYQVFKGNNSTPEKTYVFCEEFEQPDLGKQGNAFTKAVEYSRLIIADKDTINTEEIIFDSTKNKL